MIGAMATTEPHATGILAEALQRLLDGRDADQRRLTGPRRKAVTREVNRLCDEVRGDGEALVDAFGSPDQVLRAPIGLRDPS